MADGEAEKLPSDDQHQDKELTQQLLAALGITRVIHVDDDHTLPDEESLEDVIGAVETDNLPQEMVKAALSNPEMERDLSQVIDDLRTEWEDLRPEVRVDLTRGARKTQQTSDDKKSIREADVAALVILKELVVPITYLPLGLGDWRQLASDLLADTQPTLMLIDRDFTRENFPSNEGEREVRSILGRADLGTVYVGLFTHTAEGDDGEEELEQNLQEESSSLLITVIAKDQLKTPGAFPKALRKLLYAGELEAFRAHAINGLKDASKQSIERLESITRYSLLDAFEAARKEGVFETDMVMRIAASVAQKRLATSLREPMFLEKTLRPLRDATAIQLYFQQEPPAETADFIWHDQFEDGEHLNDLALPIEIGDIFRVYDLEKQGKEGYFILLAQECEIGIRELGTRAYQPASLVLTKLSEVQTRGGSSHDNKKAIYPLGRLFRERDSDWNVCFDEHIRVPILAIDACATSGTGHSILDLGKAAPLALPGSWIARHEHMMSKLRGIIEKYKDVETTLDGAMNRAITSIDAELAEATGARKKVLKKEKAKLLKQKDDVLSHVKSSILDTSTDLTTRINSTDGKIEYGLERCSRVIDHTARGLFMLMTSHHARPAFGADLFRYSMPTSVPNHPTAT